MKLQLECAIRIPPRWYGMATTWQVLFPGFPADPIWCIPAPDRSGANPMQRREQDYLDALTWFESLARLSAWTAMGAPLANSLRIAHHLARLAPPPYSTIVRCGPDEQAFEALIERAAFEAAATALVGTALSCEVLARSASGMATARVWLDGDAKEAEATEESPALALLQAWTRFMLALAPQWPDQGTGSSQRSA